MKVKRNFPLFQSHLDLAHFYWEKMAREGAWALDATCGNGHDTLKLLELFEGVIALDIQEEALESTKALVGENNRVHFFCQSHATFPSLAYENPIQLIVYNLGYLPGGVKGLTTQVASTLESLKQALELITMGGLISITCYPGHEEGAREEAALLPFLATLDSKIWSISHHVWENRKRAPSLIFIQKNL